MCCGLYFPRLACECPGIGERGFRSVASSQNQLARQRLRRYECLLVARSFPTTPEKEKRKLEGILVMAEVEIPANADFV